MRIRLDDAAARLPDELQRAFYGSNSYWPNSTFYARPIPGHPTAVVAVISGHHGVARMGELVVFDPAKGRSENEGAVRRIPSNGRPVEPLIMDTLVDSVWPKFLHPYPIDQKTFLVSCKPRPDAPWGLYLADVFDNLVPLLEDPNFALLEPLPLRATPPPPVIPERVKPGEKREEGTSRKSDEKFGSPKENTDASRELRPTPKGLNHRIPG